MKSSHTARAAIGVVALLLTFAVAGCDEDDPSGSPPPSSTPSSPDASSPTEGTSTPTETGPVEPTLPVDADEETRAGARTFVEFYWAAVNYAQVTGDTKLLKGLSIQSCAGCNGGIESIEKVYRRGGRIIGGRFSLLHATPGQTPSGAWHVSTNVRVARRQVADAGPLNEISRPGRVGFLFGLDYHDGAWSVTFLDVA